VAAWFILSCWSASTEEPESRSATGIVPADIPGPETHTVLGSGAGRDMQDLGSGSGHWLDQLITGCCSRAPGWLLLQGSWAPLHADSAVLPQQAVARLSRLSHRGHKFCVSPGCHQADRLAEISSRSWFDSRSLTLFGNPPEPMGLGRWGRTVANTADALIAAKTRSLNAQVRGTRLGA